MRQSPASKQNLIIHQVPVSQLMLATYNPRTMSPAELEKLQTSLARWGFVEPLVVRRQDQMVIGGHQRLHAAVLLGLQTVPVVYVDVSASEAKALNLALNKIQGEWDLPKLGALLEELRSAPDLDETLSGFDSMEIEGLLAELERQQPATLNEDDFAGEEAFAADEQASGPCRVQPGELWRLGKHRLFCGDATEEESWQKLMGEKQAQAVITDPPYAVSYCGGRAAQENRIARAARH